MEAEEAESTALASVLYLTKVFLLQSNMVEGITRQDGKCASSPYKNH
jgi:hypothetical protein